MPQQAHLRVYGQAEVEVELLTGYLSDLKHAYESIIVFENVIDGMQRAFRDAPFWGQRLDWPLVASRRVLRYPRRWPPTRAEIASLVPRSEQLVLAAANLSSPGFWEFLGTLNALEVVRKWLNDRHERRKDREFRETAEKRRLELENFQNETQAIADRIKLAKELGATDYDIAPLLNDLIYNPLSRLERYQDKGVIEDAEIILRLPDHRR
jgi:hypothetical protein